MSDQVVSRESAQWRDLRDDRGKLMARIEPHSLLLQIRRNDLTFTFDLRDYMDFAQDIERAQGV